jgi:putative ABC transport system permease protein
VIDAIPVIIGQAGGAQGGFGGRSTFDVRGVNPNAASFEPVPVDFRVPGIPNSPVASVKIIGVISTDGANYPGLYVSNKLVNQVSPVPLPVGTFFFKLAPGADPEQVRLALGTQFMNNGLEPTVISDELRKAAAIGSGLNGLLQGFMALGLLVGVAALGVISTRAVVERRQQIGVLRAIGYQRGMVGASFLLESSFVALLGILIGVGLGLLLSYNMVQSFAQDTPTIKFDVPWLQIGGIVLLAYLISLVTTILPARSASRIYPAEALRYE